MKAKKIVGLNIFIILVAILYAIVLIVGNVKTVKSSVAVEDGSYAKQYAEDNKLNMVTLADSEKVYFDQRYETFSYNVDGNEIILEKYEGKSTDLVIPENINGKKVSTLSAEFMNSLDTVKKIYISNSVKMIEGNPVTGVMICCADNNAFYKDNIDSEWEFETVYDSAFINFDLGNVPYEYNVNGNNIEITRYDGTKKDLIVIPSYINGMPVTDVSMDLLGTAGIIVLPATISNISGTAVKHLYSPLFAVELIFSIIAFILALVVIDILLPRYKKDKLEEFKLTGNQVVAVILYVVAQTGFGIYSIYFRHIPVYLALIVSLVILVVFVAVVMMGGAGRSHVKEVEKHIEEKTSRMKAIKQSARNMSGDIKDAEVRKLVQRVEEEIRFSDAVTTVELDDIESEIEDMIRELKKTIADGDNDKIIECANALMKIVQERNAICKAGK